MVTNVELYELLKPSIGEEAAMALAEVLPAASDLATKGDIARLELKFAELETRLLRWTLVFFVPLWVAVLGAMFAILFRV